MSFSANNCRIDSLKEQLNLPVDVLRLDLIHPIISGNKWFKLKEYIRIAKGEHKSGLITFSGAFSNHIVAAAAAAKAEGLQSIGLIRGERPETLSHTLINAENLGMKLCFLSRSDYAQKKIPASISGLIENENFIVVPEGGYGLPGMMGVKEILEGVESKNYSHIVTAVGTGTTLAGLVAASLPSQKILGVVVLKNALSIRDEVNALLPVDKKDGFTLISDYHFGGYAKKNDQLISFMNDFYTATSIPTDFVYTAKSFFAIVDLFQQNYFSNNDTILAIHTGGLQGNLSLSKGTLIFD